MKRFRISFLAIIAVLAIGLTAATKAEKAEAKSALANENCYTSVTVVCTSVPQPILTDAISCTAARNQSDYLRVNAVSGFNQNLTCSGTELKFCCAILEVDDDPCEEQIEIDFKDGAGNDHFDYAKIASILCKQN